MRQEGGAREKEKKWIKDSGFDDKGVIFDA